MLSKAKANIYADKKCFLPRGITRKSPMFQGSFDILQSYIIAALEQRSKFPKEGDEVMYYSACLMERFMPRPNALSGLIRNRTFFMRCIHMLMDGYVLITRY